MSWSEILIVVVCAAFGFGMVFHFLQTREAEKKDASEKNANNGSETE